MENKKTKLERLLIEDGRVSEIDIDFCNNNYSAKINAEKIRIFGKSASYPGGEYNKTTNEIIWYLRHCCGASGFNSFLGDNCVACDNKGKTKDKTIGEAFHGNKDLVKIIEYIKKVEEEYKKFILINFGEEKINKFSRADMIPYDSIDDELIKINFKKI